MVHLCERCAQHPGRFGETSVLGPLEISQVWLCEACAAELDAQRGNDVPDDPVDLLGPVDFARLRESFAAAERETPEVRAWLGDMLVRLTARHGQDLPDDVAAVVQGWRQTAAG